MISPDIENLIVKFLKKNCYGDFNYIMGYQSRSFIPPSVPIGRSPFEYTCPDIKYELIIMCNFKTFDSFPGYSFLGDKLYNTLKPVLKGIDKVSIESNSSTYYCKD
jgi:hypothetical protein